MENIANPFHAILSFWFRRFRFLAYSNRRNINFTLRGDASNPLGKAELNYSTNFVKKKKLHLVYIAVLFE